MEHILITKMLIVCEQISISLLSMNELNEGSVKIELFSNVIWSEQKQRQPATKKITLRSKLKSNEKYIKSNSFYKSIVF